MPRLRAPALSISISLLIVLSALPAAAQDATPELSIRLASQALWRAPGDRLGLEVRVVNRGERPIDGLRLQVAVYERVRSRFELQRSYDGVDEATPPLASFIRELDRKIPGGGGTRLSLRDRIDPQTFYSLARTREPGVFPVTVGLFDAALRPVDSFTTYLIYYPEPPEVPLGIVPVVPINALPSRMPDGTLAPVEGADIGLEQAVAEDGWLQGLLRALDENVRDGLRVSVAPAPRFVEELADVANGYKRATTEDIEQVGGGSPTARGAQGALERLRGLVAHRGVQRLMTPYSFPDLPALAEHLAGDSVLQQLLEGEEVLERTLEADFRRRWLFPPAGRLDAAALDALKQLQAADKTFFSASSLEPIEDPDSPGCPESFASFTCPVVVESGEGTTTGFENDSGLQQRLATVMGRGNDVLDLQRFFAETAMVHLEIPGTPKRVVHVTVPSTWHPTPRQSRRLFGRLAEAPWLETYTANQGLKHALKPVPRDLATELPEVRGTPDDRYYGDIERARKVVASFATIRPPAALVDRLRRNILTAESRSWWRDPELLLTGLAFALDSADEAEEELQKVRVEAPDQLTLTSRTGPVQLLVVNDTGYPATLRIELDSQKLEFEREEITQTFEPQTTPLEVEVTAHSSGIFPLDVALFTPAGEAIQPNGVKSISVKSTELNEVALAITIGALAFLVLFYLLRALRSRRGRGGKESAEATAS